MLEAISASETRVVYFSWVGARPQCTLTSSKEHLHQRTSYLGFDEGSQGPLAQLGRHLPAAAERRGHHLPSGTVHIDEVDQAWEVLQVGEGLS